MPPLDNPKEELVAQALSKGATKGEAYVAGGFAENDSNCSRYVNGNERILRRVKELQSEMAEATKVDANYITQKLELIVEECTKHGPIENKVGEIVTYLRLDATGATGALDKLAKHIGYYKKDNEQAKPERIKLPDTLRVHLDKMGIDIEGET